MQPIGYNQSYSRQASSVSNTSLSLKAGFSVCLFAMQENGLVPYHAVHNQHVSEQSQRADGGVNSRNGDGDDHRRSLVRYALLCAPI